MTKNEPKIRYFLYARKSSSEVEDRQVASIDAQIDELKKLAKDQGLVIDEIFSESQSAKKPGRPIFTQMIERLHAGEAGGILCWKLDRLARNPVDSGQISWLLQQGIIRHIQTYGKGYSPSDNVLTMSFEFGQANQFILDLSVNVKRGLRRKVNQGWITGVAPSGYLNTPDKEKGSKIITDDPLRFPLVRKMWDLMLTGNFPPTKILETANNEWGYRTLKRKREGDQPLSRSGIYRIFTNPFYCGRFEYPKGSSDWYKGSHTPMVSEEEFERVQVLLGRKIRLMPHKHTFPFTGLMRCGECGCQITAETKRQIICSNCKNKFASGNKDGCPRCNTAIQQMTRPTKLEYTYYHCTKRRKQKCSQGSIDAKGLEEQIGAFLGNIQISQKYLDWALRHLRDSQGTEITNREAVLESRQKAYASASKKLDRLLEMRLADEIGEEEYAVKKRDLLAEKGRNQELLKDADDRQNKWIELSERTFVFARHAKYWFEEGDMQRKREILAAIGSNLILTDKKLHITPQEPFRILGDGLAGVPNEGVPFEPEKIGATQMKNARRNDARLSWLRSPEQHPK